MGNALVTAAIAKVPPGPSDGLFGVTFYPQLQKDPLRFAIDVAREYGDFAYVRMGWVQLFYVNRPELIREVLVTKMKSFRRLPRQMKALSKVEGNGLVVAEGESWARHRPVVQNAFHARHFEKYAATIVEHTVRRMNGWTPGRPFDLGPEMNELALEIISKLVFGEDWSQHASKLRESIQIIRQSMVREVTAPIVLPDWLPLPSKIRLRHALAVINERVWSRIRERRETNVSRDDMLALMLVNAAALDASPPIRDAEIRDEAATLFVAGHDTTSASMAWLWYALATNPDVERRAIDEVDAVLGDREPGFSDYPLLKYVEMVVKESMRKYPAAGFIFGRQAVEPVELGGHIVPKGAWILISPHVVQNDHRNFPNPEVFDPQRFAPGRIEQIPPYAYIPFGGGVRICMANSLAVVEMTLLAATVLRRYRLVMLPGQQVEPHIEVVSRPKGALMVCAEPRHAAARRVAAAPNPLAVS